ncbi:hypothetical protein VKT23_003531 [Stygiomarasmius scandens]|uniref:Rad60/SUMO-like domain-containing protein n=1 Tax=Marasmiellus scandens TaxID=2682957 RepID=A0ABR1K3Z0_9AGAR
MSSATSQPRPRPRPKPVPKAKIPNGPGPTPTPGASATYEVQDSDEMFIRNRARDRDAWAQLEKLDKAKEAKSKEIVVSSSDDNDSDRESTPGPGRKVKSKGKEKKVVNNLPLWERNKKFKRYVSQSKSSDEDEDSDDSIKLVDVNKTPNAHGNLKRKRGNERKRSRSKSITPPPEVPRHQLQNAKDIVRKTLGVTRATSSPDLDDDFKLDDTQNRLDPELAEYARKHAQSHPRATSSGPEDKVTVRVRWQPHPQDPSGKKTITEFRLEKHDNFTSLFEAIAEEAGILSQDVVMTYHNNRFFPSVTPDALKIWDRAELVACDKETWDHLRKESKEIRFSSQQPPSKPTSSSIQVNDDSDDEIIVLGDGDDSSEVELAPEPELASQPQLAAADEEDAGPTFRLVLRSGKTQSDITLTVRPTTKCGAIVKAFLKKAGLANSSEYADFLEGKVQDSAGAKGAKKPRKSVKNVAASTQKTPTLCVDGDRVGNDTEIGDQDLEDGDMIEVVGL